MTWSRFVATLQMQMAQVSETGFGFTNRLCAAFKQNMSVLVISLRLLCTFRIGSPYEYSYDSFGAAKLTWLGSAVI